MNGGVVVLGVFILIIGGSAIFFTNSTYNREYDEITQKYFEKGYDMGASGDLTEFPELLSDEIEEKQDLKDKYQIYYWASFVCITIGITVFIVGLVTRNENDMNKKPKSTETIKQKVNVDNKNFLMLRSYQSRILILIKVNILKYAHIVKVNSIINIKRTVYSVLIVVIY